MGDVRTHARVAARMGTGADLLKSWRLCPLAIGTRIDRKMEAKGHQVIHAVDGQCKGAR